MDAVQYFTENYSEFFWQVLIPIFLWLGLMLGFFIFLFVKFTFGKWTTENPNPYAKETWGMPRGTFRGVLTLTLVYITVVLELVNVRIIGFETEIHEFMIAFQMMIAFYFGSKVMHHITSSDKKKTYAVSNSNQSNSSSYNANSSTSQSSYNDSDFDSADAQG